MVTIRLRSTVWFVCGAVIAAAVMLMFASAWQVDAAPGDTDSTFVPITACRLTDTRPAPSRVGPHEMLSANSTTMIPARMTNGECAIPSEAVGLSLNVTALNADALTFLTLWPSGPLPLAASLNPAPGQPPVPNAVTVPLSETGAFNVYNESGSVDIVIDVNGYYTKTSLAGLNTRLAEAEAKIAVSEAKIAVSETMIAALDLAQPLGVTEAEAVPEPTILTDTPTAIVSISFTAPVTGQVTLNSTARVAHLVDGGDVVCAIFETVSIPTTDISVETPSIQWFEAFSTGNDGSVSGTQTFSIAGGATVSYSLACEESTDGGIAYTRNLTAIFTPAP